MKNIVISKYTEEIRDALAQLLMNSSFLPNRFLRRYIGTELVPFILDDISSLVEDEDCEFIIATRDSDVIGLLGCIYRPWDSRVTGSQTLEIKYLIYSEDCSDKEGLILQLLDHAELFASEKHIEYLLCKIHTDNIPLANVLEKKGFLITDTLLDFVYFPQKTPLRMIEPPILAEGVLIRLADINDVDELIGVARAAFKNHFGRFHLDDRIDRRKATSVYEQWIKSSCEGYADWVTVATIDGRIAGYSAWKKPLPTESRLTIRPGHYSIAAIHPDFSGRGLFSSLTYNGMQLLSSCSDCIEGPTHINNYPVQNAYSKLAWRICDARHSFHKWLKA